MQDSPLFTILHISDFHFSRKKQREQGIVIDALVADLEAICIGHRKPDIVAFTGDLVQAAGTDLHDNAYDFLIDRVSKATRCSDERIFLTPGNHDLSWAGLDRYGDQTRIWRRIIGAGDENDQFNAIYASGAFNEAINDKFSNFLSLEQYVSSGSAARQRILSNPFVSVDRISEINLDYVSFNTAALSSGGHKSYDRDERNLVIPEYAVMEAMACLTEGSLRIVATHHPLNWLSDQSARYLEDQITKYGMLHLFGHMHDPQPKSVVGLRGKLLVDQAGAIFTSRKDSYNGYSLITIDRDQQLAETMVRSYYKDRNEFDAGIDIIEEGKWWSSQRSREYFRGIATPVDEDKLRFHLAGSAFESLRYREDQLGSDSHDHEKFVAPPLKRTFFQEPSEDEGKVRGETSVDFGDIVNSDTNLILYGKPEYGRTTLLREIRYQYLVAADKIRFPRLPVLLSFLEITSNSDNLLRKVKGAAEQAPDDNDIESLLKLGYVLLLIDDVIFGDAKRMKILRDFIARFPKARYILSSPQASATIFGASVDPEVPVRFEFVEVREFRRNDMRQLLERDVRCTDVEEWLDRLQEEFKEINLPFTAANGTILIEILSEKYNFTPINRAVLMEQFVDSTLRKAAIEQSKRETFDYTNKTDLLAHIASWMAYRDDYVPSKESVRSEMKSYVDARGLNVDLDELLAEFFSAKMFIVKGQGTLSFRYRGVLEYFIALRMTVDGAFKEWVLDERRYLRFLSEILYYAGKVRNDAALLDLVGDRHKVVMKSALNEAGNIDLTQFENIVLPTDDEAGALIEEAIAAAPLTKTQKDSELEAGAPVDAEDRQEVHRPDIDDVGDRSMASLVLYSGLVKNLELIPDSDKRRHLSEVWDGWASFLLLALGLAPKLAKDRRIRVNGARYDVQAPHGMSDSKLLRQIMVALPHIHIKLLSNALGTEKLERQLTEPSLSDVSRPKIIEFLRAGLISDLKLAATPSAVTSLAHNLRSNHYLLWSLIVHISELRRLDRVREEHYTALQVPLAGAIADLRGGTRRDRESTKRSQIVRLERDRLLLTMKRDKERR